MLFSDATRSWIAYQDQSWSFINQVKYRAFVRGWLEVVGDKDVALVTANDVERVEARRAGAGMAGSTLNGEKAALRQFFRWAIIHKLCKEDLSVVWRHRKHTVDEDHYQMVSLEEEPKLLEAAGAYQGWSDLRKFIVTALYTGQRVGTIRAYDWAWVRTTAGGKAILKIPAGVTKTGAAHDMPLLPTVLEAWGPRPAAGGLLFPGMPASSHVWTCFKTVAARAGLSAHLKPHDLRATCATRLLDSGVPAPVVQRLIGWKTMSVMLSRYMRKLEAERGYEAMSVLERRA